jgi:hypothetical protein
MKPYPEMTPAEQRQADRQARRYSANEAMPPATGRKMKKSQRPDRKEKR